MSATDRPLGDEAATCADNSLGSGSDDEAATILDNEAPTKPAPATCAAGELCTMKGTPLEDPNNGNLGHSGCMDCRKPIHGPLCGANWTERNPGLNLPENLFPASKKHANAVICALCIRKHQPTGVKAITLDDEDDNAAVANSSRKNQSRKFIADAPSALSPPGPPSKKRKDENLYRCFTIARKAFSVDVACNHCPWVQKEIKTFNSTRGRNHAVNECPGIDETMRELLRKTSQNAKKIEKMAKLSMSSSSMTELRASALAVASITVKRASSSSNHNATFFPIQRWLQRRSLPGRVSSLQSTASKALDQE